MRYIIHWKIWKFETNTLNNHPLNKKTLIEKQKKSITRKPKLKNKKILLKKQKINHNKTLIEKKKKNHLKKTLIENKDKKWNFLILRLNGLILVSLNTKELAIENETHIHTYYLITIINTWEAEVHRFG